MKKETLDGWQWQEWEGLLYLTSDLLKDWQHGFFTRQCYPRLPEDLVAALDSDAKVYRVKQVHGNAVLTPTEIAAAPKEDATFPNADGVITESAKQGVWVASADCSPVLIGDRSSGSVAAVHAGWRGTSLEIVPNAVKRFLDRGSKLENLLVAIGPAIAGEVYQVSETVATEVSKTVTKESEVISALLAMDRSPLLPDPQPGRVKLDVRRVNELQLRAMGLTESQIAIAPFCTYQDEDYFFSYRRSKLKKVQWSGIVSK